MRGSNQGHRWATALALYEAANGFGLVPDVVVFGAAVAACEVGQRWQRALSILLGLPRHRLKPSTIMWNSAVSSCEKGNSWQAALGLLRGTAVEAGLKLDVISFNAATSACAGVADWQRSLEAFGLCRGAGVFPDDFTINAAATACDKSLAWRFACWMLPEARSCGIEPTQVTSHCVLAACERSLQWEAAAEELVGLATRSIAADAVAISSTVAACGRGDSWQVALGWHKRAASARSTTGLRGATALAAAGACLHSGQSLPAKELLLEAISLRRVGSHEDDAGWLATTSVAASQLGMWEHCLALLEDAWRRRVGSSQDFVVLHRNVATAAGCAGSSVAALAALAVARRRCLLGDMSTGNDKFEISEKPMADKEGTIISATMWALEVAGRDLSDLTIDSLPEITACE
eukprot:TRINITY_DN51697_c0_g1_i2.p1 TRINITY_DN51697_c0_g1~~TRINITY_DN51697_c0_g1_i2.p1  ORF type:complete len:406 (-),score=46.83 TRINITY_DN51697_c0_g1_i2:68-1285(-)